MMNVCVFIRSGLHLVFLSCTLLSVISHNLFIQDGLHISCFETVVSVGLNTLRINETNTHMYNIGNVTFSWQLGIAISIISN